MLKQAQEMLRLNTVAGMGMRVRTDGATISLLESEMKLVDTVSSCPSNYHGAGKVFCSDMADEGLLTENWSGKASGHCLSCDRLDEVPLSLLTAHIAKLDVFNDCH